MTKSETEKTIARLRALNKSRKSPTILNFLDDLDEVKGRSAFRKASGKTSFIAGTGIERLREARAVLEEDFYGKRGKEG